MDRAIRSIIKSASRLGACSKVKDVTDIKSLVRLFFSPQGKEFCDEHNFPSLKEYRSLIKYDMSKFGVYIDSGALTLRNGENIALVGNTQAELIYEGVERKYTVILMHGATAIIRACSHSVIEVVNVRCKVTYNVDKTVALL